MGGRVLIDSPHRHGEHGMAVLVNARWASAIMARVALREHILCVVAPFCSRRPRRKAHGRAISSGTVARPIDYIVANSGVSNRLCATHSLT